MKRWMVWSVVGLVVFLGGPACTRAQEESPEASAPGQAGESQPCVSDTVRIAIGPRSFRYPEKETNPIPRVCLGQPFPLDVTLEEDGVDSFSLGNYRLVMLHPDTGRWVLTQWGVTIGTVEDQGYLVEGEGNTAAAVFKVKEGEQQFSFQLNPSEGSKEEVFRQLHQERYLLLFTVTIVGEAGVITFDPPWDPKGPTG